MHPSLSSRSFLSSSSSSSSIVKNFSKDSTDEKQTTTLSQSPESQNPPSSHGATEVQHNHVIRVEPDDITFTNVQKNQVRLRGEATVGNFSNPATNILLTRTSISPRFLPPLFLELQSNGSFDEFSLCSGRVSCSCRYAESLLTLADSFQFEAE